MKKRAPAKINLFLKVLGPIPGGYHEIQTIIQAIDLCDEVEVGPAPATTVTFDSVFGEPARPDLVERAIEAMQKRLGTASSFEAHVLKAIPMGSGLGGGSSDAAATIAAVNELSGDPLLIPELTEVAAGLGADVAFFLHGGTAMARGRGEVIEPIQCPETLWWVIVMPEDGLSTADVYRRYDEMVPALTPETPNELVAALAAGDTTAIGSCLHNDLELPAFDLRPELADLKSDLLTLGALGAVMTGSGSALAALCPTPQAAASIAQQLEGRTSFIQIAGSLPPLDR